MNILPIVIPEDMIKPFCYWQDSIQFGMSYQGELYTQVKRYGSHQRLEAYEHAYQISETGWSVCITVTDRNYVLWRNLRSVAMQRQSANVEDEAVSHRDLIAC